MSTRHTVQEGECTTSIADKYGFFRDTIWDDAANADLKAERNGDPDVLAPGDVIVIMDKREKEVVKSSGTRHRFRRRGVPACFRLRLLRSGKPRPDLSYELTVGSLVKTGRTDANGVLEQWLDPQVKQGQLRLEDGQQYAILFRHLDPVETTQGLHARLANLGFLPSEDNDTDQEELLRSGIKAFQEKHNLPPTGKADAATEEKLLEKHGN